MSEQNPHLVAGMDVGGTKSEVRIDPHVSPNTHVYYGSGCNLMSDGIRRAVDVICASLEGVLKACPYRGPVRLVVGIAGGGRRDDRIALRRAILDRKDHSIAEVTVESDAVIALESAFNGSSGIVVIAGTGSGVYARDRTHQFQRTGGWGSILGDPGSGYDIGVHGLRVAAHAMDRNAANELLTRLQNEFGIDTRDKLFEAVYSRNFHPGTFAPAVIDSGMNGNPAAGRIVEDSVQALARDAAALLERGCDLAPRYALMGGLMRSRWYRGLLEKALSVSLPGFTRVEVRVSAAEGALHLAEKLWPRQNQFGDG